jgi:hypothetical protein
MALREKHRAHQLKAWEGGGEATYKQDHRYHEAHVQEELNAKNAAIGEQQAKRDFEREVANNEDLRRLDVQSRVLQEQATLEADRNTTYYDAIKTKPGIANAAIRNLATEAHDTSTNALDEKQRQSSVHLEHENRYWSALATDEARQAYAGAEGIAEHGEARVANIARQKQTEEREKRVNAAISNLSTVEARLDEERAVILGDTANAGRFTSLLEDVESRSGALRRYVDRAPIEQVQTLIRELDITLAANGDPEAEMLRSELAGALKKRKPFYISQTLLNRIEEGTLDTAYYGVPGQRRMIQEALDGGALSINAMAQTADRDDLAASVEYIRSGGAISAATRAQLRTNLRTVTEDNRYSGMIDKRKKELGELWDELNGPGTRPENLR